MRYIRKHVITLFVLFLLVFSYGLSLIYSRQTDDSQKKSMLYFKDNPITGREAANMQSSEAEAEVPVDFTFWGVKADQTVENNGLARSAQTKLYYMVGNTELLFTSNGYLDQNDYEGCLLGAGTAYELFGSTDIVGKTVQYGGKDYVIRGIILGAENVFAIQAGSIKESILNAAAIYIPSGRLEQSVLDAFISRHGVAGTKVDLSRFVSWSKALAALLPVIIGFIILTAVIKYLLQIRDRIVVFSLGIVGWIGFFVFYVWIFDLTFSFPQDMVPNRWSDFSYWSSWLKTQRTEILTLFSMEYNLPELGYLESFIRTLVYSIFTVVLFLILKKRMEIDSLGQLYLYLIAAAVSAYLTILFNQGHIEILAANLSFWGAAAVFMIFTFVKRRAAGGGKLITLS